jgi:hypothetical protein
MSSARSCQAEVEVVTSLRPLERQGPVLRPGIGTCNIQHRNIRIIRDVGSFVICMAIAWGPQLSGLVIDAKTVLPDGYKESTVLTLPCTLLSGKIEKWRLCRAGK